MRPRHRLLVLAIVISILGVAALGGWLWAHSSGPPRTSTGTGGCDTTTYPPPPSSVPTTLAPATTTTPPSTAVPSTTATSVNVLREGDHGPAVLALQQRLSSLGYWLGGIDGRYGASTYHAVVAFQKAQGIARDGTAGPATLDAMNRAGRFQPRSHSGRLVEIDLSRQLLIVVVDGRVEWVMDACTGSRPGSTPAGVFHVFRQVDGYDRSPLGVLYRPKYFYNGVAIHGYPLVPPQPASHGCVRVTNSEMDWLWSNAAMPIGSEVWVY